MPKKASITINFIFNFLNQILTVIAPCITVPYLARTLGPAGLGEYSFALSLVTYFSAFTNLGVNLYGQRQIAYLKDKSREVYSKAFWELIFLRCFTGVISIILYYLIVIRLSHSHLLSTILSLEILSVIFDVTWLYQGFENFKIIVVRNFIVRILSIIAIFTFVKEPYHLYRYAVILSGSNFLGALSMWFSLKNYVILIPIRELHVFSHLKGAFALYLPQIAIQVYTVLDKTMLGLIVKSNYETGNGRSDIIIKNNPNLRAAILELKIAKNIADIPVKCDEALQQIKDRNYAQPLIDEEGLDVISYGVTFYKKKCFIKKG